MPIPGQIHNLHEILLQKHIGFTRLRANPAKKQKVQGRHVRCKLLMGNYYEYFIHSISKLFKVGSWLTIKESTYKSIYFSGPVFYALSDGLKDPSPFLYL